MSLRKFEFETIELAHQFIEAHQSQSDRQDFIGPMQMATAWEGEGEERVPITFTGWMIDTDRVDPLPEWQQYEVTPTSPVHQITGREQEYNSQIQNP